MQTTPRAARRRPRTITVVLIRMRQNVIADNSVSLYSKWWQQLLCNNAKLRKSVGDVKFPKKYKLPTRALHHTRKASGRSHVQSIICRSSCLLVVLHAVQGVLH